MLGINLVLADFCHELLGQILRFRPALIPVTAIDRLIRGTQAVTEAPVIPRSLRFRFALIKVYVFDSDSQANGYRVAALALIMRLYNFICPIGFNISSSSRIVGTPGPDVPVSEHNVSRLLDFSTLHFRVSILCTAALRTSDDLGCGSRVDRFRHWQSNQEIVQ